MLNAAAKKARSTPPLLQLDTQNKRPNALAGGNNDNAGTVTLGLTIPSMR